MRRLRLPARLQRLVHGRPADPSRLLDDAEALTYDPSLDGDADPGEVVWTWVPFEDDPSQGKDRPVLVVARDGHDVVAVPLSSRNHRGRADAHDWVAVGRGGWDGEGRISYADLSRLLTVDQDQVRREGAVLDRRRFDEVVAAVRRHHGLAAGERLR